MCCSEIGTLPAQGRAKSCRSVPGSSPHRHSGANAYEVGWWKGIRVHRCRRLQSGGIRAPIRLKSDAPEAFKIFKAAAENEYQKRIREVMTDNARELSMGEMRQICEQEGIKPHTSVRYSPESTEVVERTIGVLTNAMRATLHDSGLPSRILWAEAYNAATYLHNRTPTRALGGQTPSEVLCGVKPDVSHLRAVDGERRNRWHFDDRPGAGTRSRRRTRSGGLQGK